VLSLTFRGHREHVGAGECEGGNFQGLVAMQAKFDPVLQSCNELSCSCNKVPECLSPE